MIKQIIPTPTQTAINTINVGNGSGSDTNRPVAVSTTDTTSGIDSVPAAAALKIFHHRVYENGKLKDDTLTVSCALELAATPTIDDPALSSHTRKSEN